MAYILECIKKYFKINPISGKNSLWDEYLT